MATVSPVTDSLPWCSNASVQPARGLTKPVLPVSMRVLKPTSLLAGIRARPLPWHATGN